MQTRKDAERVVALCKLRDRLHGVDEASELPTRLFPDEWAALLKREVAAQIATVDQELEALGVRDET